MHAAFDFLRLKISSASKKIVLGVVSIDLVDDVSNAAQRERKSFGAVRRIRIDFPLVVDIFLAASTVLLRRQQKYRTPHCDTTSHRPGLHLSHPKLIS